MKINTAVLLGLGREGRSNYSFITSRNPNVTILCFDDKPLENLGDFWQKELKNNKNAHFFSNKDEFFKFLGDLFKDKAPNEAILVVKTPGMPPNHPVFTNLSEKFSSNCKFTSNTQLFFDLIRRAPFQSKVIGVTGTKGKSTTSAAIQHVLSSAGLPSYLGGNIGLPPLDLYLTQLSLHSSDSGPNPSRTSPIFVLEMSSHQLADLKNSPDISVVQNITPEHLDYYPNFESYVEAKKQIVKFQNSDDLLVYCSDDEIPSKWAKESEAQTADFCGAKSEIRIEDQRILMTDPETKIEKVVVELADLPLKGEHTLRNLVPAVLIAKRLGVALPDIQRALLTFTSLPHRMEYVTTIKGVEYYNDSLSTTPEATIAAIKSFAKGSVVLIAGGHDRSLKFEELAEEVFTKKLKAVVLLPNTGEKIESAIIQYYQKNRDKSLNLPIIEHAENLSQAVRLAKAAARTGNVVLLSPAAASFNMFVDYAERGEEFKKQVLG